MGKGSRHLWTIILVVAGSLLLLFATVAVWTHSVALNTDRYVEIVDSLISDEAIVDSLATSITNRLFQQLDVEEALRDRLPESMQFLAEPLTDSLYRFTLETAQNIISSDRFHQIWVQANQTMHQELVRFLRGESEALSLIDGQVTLDLGQVASDLRDRLAEKGVDIFERIQLENVDTEVVLLESETLQRLQAIVFWLDRLAFLLPVVVLICYGLAIIIAPPQFRIPATIYVGAGIVISMILLEIGLLLVRSSYLDSISGANLTPQAAAVLFDTVFATLGSWALLIQAFGAGIIIIGGIIGRTLRQAGG